MPGFLLNVGAVITCSHGGQAMPTVPSTSVMVDGQPATTMASAYVIAGCPFVPPGGNGPCVTAEFITTATQILIGGQPALLIDSQAICAPTGTPTIVMVTQMSVMGT